MTQEGKASLEERIFSYVVQNQKSISAALGLYGFFSPYITNEWAPSIWTSATPAYLAYLGLGIGKERLISSSYRDPQYSSLGKRTKEMVFSNIKPLTILGGALAAGLYYGYVSSLEKGYVEAVPPRTIGEFAS